MRLQHGIGLATPDIVVLRQLLNLINSQNKEFLKIKTINRT